MVLRNEAFVDIVGKGENAGKQHFLLSPHFVFYSSKKKFQFLSDIYFVVYKCFQSGLLPDFVVW